MFGKQSKNVRLENLEEDVDDLCYEMFCDHNPMNINKRLHRLEEFKGVTVAKIVEDCNLNFIQTDRNTKAIKEKFENIYDLYERLGQKVKDNDTGAKETILALFKYLGLTLNEQGEVIKVKTNKTKNVKPTTKKSPTKSSKRK